eukprot:748343-Hanusia_phi.AAC.1
MRSRSPSFTEVFGCAKDQDALFLKPASYTCHPSSRDATVISGRRCWASSCADGMCTIELSVDQVRHSISSAAPVGLGQILDHLGKLSASCKVNGALRPENHRILYSSGFPMFTGLSYTPASNPVIMILCLIVSPSISAIRPATRSSTYWKLLVALPSPGTVKSCPWSSAIIDHSLLPHSTTTCSA